MDLHVLLLINLVLCDLRGRSAEDTGMGRPREEGRLTSAKLSARFTILPLTRANSVTM